MVRLAVTFGRFLCLVFVVLFKRRIHPAVTFLADVAKVTLLSRIKEEKMKMEPGKSI